MIFRRSFALLLLALPLGGCGSPDSRDQVAADSLPGEPPSLLPVVTATPPPDTLTDSTDVVGLRREVRELRTVVLLLSENIRLRQASDSAAVGTAPPTPTAAEAVEGVRHYGVRTLWAVVVLGGTWLAVHALSWLLAALAARSAKRRLFYMRFLPIVRLVTYSVAVYVLIAWVYGVDRNGLLAAGAAIGVGVGFASQGVLKNLFGGLVIIFDQPFQVGDKVRIGGTYGEVVNIGLRATRLVTPDDNLVSVPNGAVVEGQVANANAGALDCQVVIDLYLPGWVDVSRAKEIARSAAVMSKYVHLEKPIVVLVRDEFKETFLTQLRVKAYVLDTRYEFVFASDVTETAKAEYLRLGMLQPGFPVRLVEAPSPGIDSAAG